jgi:hypothetical protein
MDGVMEDDDVDQEADEEVDKVIEEITLGVKNAKVVHQELPSKAEAEDENEDDMKDLEKRLGALKE